VQQLREAFPYDETQRFLIHDRDAKFGERVAHALASMGVEGRPTAHRSPCQNGVAERWIGSCRRELLDHVVPFGEDHMRRLLREYIAYYAEDRTHLSLGKETQAGRETMARPDGDAEVVALPRVGGIHHRYEWRRTA
jgi:putative transposase